MTLSGTIVVVDVGNSAIKVAVQHSSDATTARHGSWADASDDALSLQSFPLNRQGWAEQICGWVSQNAHDSELSWWVSTVNRAASGPLRDAVSVAFPQSSWQTLCHEDVPMQTEVDQPERLGIDRLIGAYAASIRCSTPLVVVDAGSAVTVDWVRNGPSGRPVFAGGAILPGICLQHAVLATGTEGLQRPPDEQGPDVHGVATLGPATTTEKAIRLGVMAAVAGGIDRLAEEYAFGQESPPLGKKNGSADRPGLLLTGGDGPIISPYLRTKHDLIPHLVCLGLLDLATRECQNTPSGLK